MHWILATTVMALAATNVTAQNVRLESIGQPCRAKNILAGCVVTDRATGKEQFVVTNSSEEAGLELFFIDPEANTGRVFHAPAGQGSWCVLEVPGDRLVITTYYDGKFLVFDLKTMQFTKDISFPGEQYIWNAAMGGDGRVYGGTYPGGKLGALDLNTYAVEDCGAAAPPNMYLRSVYSTGEGSLLCNYIQEDAKTLVYDPATKKYTPAPEALKSNFGLFWHGYLLVGGAAYKGKALEPVMPYPFPAPPADKGAWSVNNYACSADILCYQQGNAYYTYKFGDKAPVFVVEADLRSGRLLGVTSQGYLLGVRGQDYFVLKPGDKSVALRPLPVESSPRPILFLKADEKGRLWGGPLFGQTLFSLDPKTGKTVNTGCVCDGGGEVYGLTFHKDNVFAASYAGGDITMYNPEQPWDQWNNKNPKAVAKVSDKGYIRPVAGIMTGSDGKLYSGWMAKYGTYGGAIAITDSETGATELIENSFGEMGITGLVVDEQFAYVGTTLSANGLPSKKNAEPHFGILDLKTRDHVMDQAFPGVDTIRVLDKHARLGLVIVCLDQKLVLLDVKTRKMIELPAETPPLTGNGVLDKNAFLYTSKKDLVILDLKALKTEILMTAEKELQNVVLDRNGAIYVSSGSSIYRVVKGK